MVSAVPSAMSVPPLVRAEGRGGEERERGEAGEWERGGGRQGRGERGQEEERQGGREKGRGTENTL